MNNIYYKKTYLLFNMPSDIIIYMNTKYNHKLKYDSYTTEYKKNILEFNKSGSKKKLEIDSSKKEENKSILNYITSNIINQYLDKYIYIFI